MARKLSNRLQFIRLKSSAEVEVEKQSHSHFVCARFSVAVIQMCFEMLAAHCSLQMQKHFDAHLLQVSEQISLVKGENLGILEYLTCKYVESLNRLRVAEWKCESRS